MRSEVGDERQEITAAKRLRHVRGVKNNCSSSRSFLHHFAIDERGITASVTLKRPTGPRVAANMIHWLHRQLGAPQRQKRNSGEKRNQSTEEKRDARCSSDGSSGHARILTAVPIGETSRLHSKPRLQGQTCNRLFFSSFEHLGSLVAASDGFRVRQQIVGGKQRKT
jgi:hypothetical protein